MDVNIAREEKRGEIWGSPFPITASLSDHKADL